MHFILTKIRVRSRIVFLALLGLTSGLHANPFYVSPTGNDNNGGSEGAPFRTIERAQAAVRSVNGSQSADIIVYLRAGRYELSDTLRFDDKDSGRNGYRVIYRSYPGERPFISGGRHITGWTYYRDGIFSAISPVANFRQLYVNAKPALRARTPDSGYHRLTDWNDDYTVTIPAQHIQNWSNLNEVEMVIEKHWHQSRLRIGSFSKTGDFATIVPREPERTVEWLVQWPNREPNQAYFFENSLDFLNEPGEWYLDRSQQIVYYMPRAGENLESAAVVAPSLERLLEIRGASDLGFAGLTFEHSTWTIPDESGFVGVQGNYYRTANGIGWIPSAIHLESTRQIDLERNVMRNMGGSAIELAFGTDRTRIVGNAIADIGAGGISVYTWLSNRNPPEDQKSRGDLIRNNYLTRIARDYPGGVAILGTYTDGLVVEHNEIYDTPYSGLSIGWGWTSDDTALRNNLVRYNRIHKVMNQLDDGGGIYTLSKQPGTLIEENFISDMTRSPWAGTYEITALYLDERSEGITLRNNVVRNLSGVNVFKQNQVADGANSVSNNGPDIADAEAIIANAGLQEEFHEIRHLVSEDESSTTQAPFSGAPAPVPGRIQVEDFDHGGPGVAYQDSTSVNEGGGYRLSDQVDIETCLDNGDGFNIGYITPDEWVEYTVHVARTGSYTLLVRAASAESDTHFHMTVDGTNVTGRIDVPNTGGWQRWTTLQIDDVKLQAGEQKLRLRFDTGNFNLNWIEATPKREPFAGLPAAIPGRIWAVEFDHGGPDVAYHDTTAMNQGGEFRPDEHVDIEQATDTEAIYNIGWIESGEWVEYTVEVADAGVYDIRFRLASLLDSGRFRVLLDGTDVAGQLHVPNTGGWQNWTSVTVPQVDLKAGRQILRLFMDSGQFNISYLDAEPAASSAPELSTFDQWRQAHFSSQQLEDPAISGPAADPYGTGVTNLLNYAFHRKPSETSRKNLPAWGRIAMDGATYITLTYTRPTDAADVAYTVEMSSDMTKWSPADSQVVQVSAEQDGEATTLQLRDSEPMSSSSRRFFRVRVELTGSQ